MDLSFFIEMAWKSALISGAALALAAGLRSRSAADRTLVLRIGVAMLLLLPLIAVALPSLEIVAFAAPEAPRAIASLPVAELQLASLASFPAPEPTIWDDPTPLVILAYLGGLAMVGSRLLAGLWLLRRWTRSAREVTCPEWRAAFERVRWTAPDPDNLRLLAADGVRSPLSWGWRRPVILIDPDTLGLPEDAEAILAHEIAHIARRDWPVLMLARIAAVLFWFNPLVWMLEREVVQQAEEAADCAAAERVEPARYAETLLNWAEVNGCVPANSIAPSASALGRRVRAILDARMRERPSGSAWTALAILLCLAIAAPVAAAKLVAAQAPMPAAPPAPVGPAAAVPAPSMPQVSAAPAATHDIVISGAEIEHAHAAAAEALAEVLPQIPAIVANAMAALPQEELEQALREAGELNEADIAEAVAEAHAAAAEVRISQAEIARAVAEARRATRDIPRQVHLSLARSADGMERGADGMERGARRMEAEAHRLRTDRAYRERQIAKARERGETVTHEDLLEAADGLDEGADGMREGAQGMRESAQRMREGRE